MDDLANLSAALSEFTGQPDSPTLLLMMSDSDTLYPIKELASRDRQDPHTIYLAFPQACPNAAAYVDAIVEQIRLMFAGLAAEAPDDYASAELPEQAIDPREAPADRLVALIQAVRAQAHTETPIVWAFLPETIGDTDSYRELTRPLLPLGPVPPWAAGHHFIVRERLDASIWAQKLHEQAVDDALVFRLEVSPANVTSGLVAAASDPTNTDDERMAALTQLAGLDLAHRRLPEALAKYDALEKYFGAANNPGMRALMLGGNGDALMLAGRQQDALLRYRQGLAISAAANTYSSTLTLLLCAGRCCMTMQDWPEAEAYFGLAIDVAAKLLNFVALADSYENRGIARTEQGKHKEAAKDWIASKKVAKRYGYTQRFKSAIDRLIKMYEAAKLPAEVAKLRTERLTISSEGNSPA